MTRSETRQPATGRTAAIIDASTTTDIDVTAIHEHLRASGISTEIYGGGVCVLRVGVVRKHDRDPHDLRAQLAAGPTHWDDTSARWMSPRADFSVGPDTGTAGEDDPGDFRSFADPGETAEAIAGYIIARLGETCAGCGQPNLDGACPTCGHALDLQTPGGEGGQ